MQLRTEQLHNHLSKSLAAVYAIHGDEPLLALEAADAVRAAARKQGFSERAVLEPSRHFDWSEFTHAAASLSLFAEKKLVELRLATGKPGTQGAEAIAAYCGRPSADIVLLVSVPRLDRNTQNSAWFRALAEAGVVVDIYPVERQRLPAWIAERLARQRQSAPREVLEFLADRVEGNLLAAHQEVQKLALLAPERALGPTGFSCSIAFSTSRCSARSRRRRGAILRRSSPAPLRMRPPSTAPSRASAAARRGRSSLRLG